MGHVGVRFLTFKPDGRAYWQPSSRMIAAGFKTTRLKGTQAEIIAKANDLTAEWDAYRAQRNSGPRIGTIGHLREAYTGYDKPDRNPKKQSDEFAGLATRTQKDYGYWLDAIQETFGDLAVSALTPKTIKTYYNATVADRGLYAGYHMMIALRSFLSWCVSEDEIDDNAALKVTVRTPRSRKTRWKPEEVTAFIEAAERGGRPSMGLAVLLAEWLAQRPFDVRTLKWSNYDGRAIVGIIQGKTSRRREPTEVPAIILSPECRKALDAARKASPDAEYILVSEGNREPYSEVNFARLFAEIREDAGLSPDLKFMDFRRTAATEMAESGSGDDELRSVTGHKDRNVVSRYVPISPGLAKRAVGKRLRHRAKRAKN